MNYSFADELTGYGLDLTVSDRRTLNKVGHVIRKGSRKQFGNKIVVDIIDEDRRATRNFIIEVGEDHKIKSMTVDPNNYSTFVKLTKKETGGKSLDGYIVRLDEIIVFNNHKMYYYYGRDIGNLVPIEITNPSRSVISVKDYLKGLGIRPDESRFIEFPNYLLENIALHNPEKSMAELYDYMNDMNKRTVTRKLK